MSFAVVAVSSLLLAAEPDAGDAVAEQVAEVDAGAPAAAVMPSPVVKLGSGSGVVLEGDVLVTTKQVAFETARPQGQLLDGGTVELLGTVTGTDLDIALVSISGTVTPAVLSRSAPDAGAHLTVVTGDGTYEAIVAAVKGWSIELTIADAGVVAGAALIDERGVVFGMLTDEKRAVGAEFLAQTVDLVRAPAERQSTSSRWRNLGISAAFFLGLSVWWVYRSKRLRY